MRSLAGNMAEKSFYVRRDAYFIDFVFIELALVRRGSGLNLKDFAGREFDGVTIQFEHLQRDHITEAQGELLYPVPLYREHLERGKLGDLRRENLELILAKIKYFQRLEVAQLLYAQTD